MDFVKIKSLIREQEHKPLMSPDSLELPKYSIKEIVDCLKLAKKYYREDNNCSLNVLCPAKLRTSYQKQLLQLVDQASQENFLSLFNQFPCSFRLTNVQLYFPTVKNHHRIGFKDHNALFNANIYFTPGLKRNALDLHTDNEDIFVQQLVGQKQWHVVSKHWKPNASALEFYECLQTTALSDIDDEHKQDIILKQNNVLYLPRLTPHQATMPENNPSIHLTYAFNKSQDNEGFYNLFFHQLKHDLFYSPSTRENFSESKSRKAIEDCFAQIDLNELAKEYKKRQNLERFDIFRFGSPYGRYHLREHFKTN